MSSIIQRKINNTTYLIEVVSYRNKDGKPRNKQKCLGKLDVDGVLISTKKKLPIQIKEVKTVKKKFVVQNTFAQKKDF